MTFCVGTEIFHFCFRFTTNFILKLTNKQKNQQKQTGWDGLPFPRRLSWFLMLNSGHFLWFLLAASHFTANWLLWVRWDFCNPCENLPRVGKVSGSEKQQFTQFKALGFPLPSDAISSHATTVRAMQRMACKAARIVPLLGMSTFPSNLLKYLEKNNC